jgi:flagellar hook-basal body complex protein FliE
MQLSPVTSAYGARPTEAASLAKTELTPETTGDGPASKASGVSFGDIFAEVVGQANRADAAANEKVGALARGVNDDLHGTMIAVKEADISIKLVGSIRNKLLDAFNEIWKTSV